MSRTRYRTALGIGILVYDVDPHRAALIANEIAQTYIDDTLLIQQYDVLDKIDVLEDRMGVMERQIAVIETGLSDLILANNLDDRDIGPELLAELENVTARLNFLTDLNAPPSEIEPLERRAERVQAQLAQRSRAAQERITQEQKLEDLHTRRAILFQNSNDLAVHASLMAPLARQISVAQAAYKPALPNRKTLLDGSFVSALVVGFIVLLLREMLNKKLFVRRSVHPALELQGALAFPSFPRSARANMEALTGLFDQKRPPDPRAEGARHIQAVLMGRLAQGKSARLLVTSSSQTDQSAFIALSLAISAARDGLKVLVIDLNPIEDSSVVDLLPNRRSQYGLPLLLGNALLMAQEVEEVVTGVDYIRPSPDAHIPFDLFEGHNLWAGTNALNERYDKILILVPPVTENAVLGRLLPFIDDVLFVVRDQSSDVEQIVRALEKLKQLNLQPVKIVNFG